MTAASLPSASRTRVGVKVRVWDLPTRLFHWSLVSCMITAFVSARSGGITAGRLHFLCGYAVLVLVGFRLAWGFAGPRYARFAQFVRGPATTLRYARSLLGRVPASSAPGYPGHNPLGALSVLALLAACGLQGATGLFATDDIASAGPLARYVSNAMVGRLTGAHDVGETALYVLLGLHLLAIAFYRWVKREDLVGPMITGDKVLPENQTAPGRAQDADDRGVWPRAALLLGLSLALVCFVVNLG
jgi:cytochrome b